MTWLRWTLLLAALRGAPPALALAAVAAAAGIEYGRRRGWFPSPPWEVSA